MDKFDAMIIGTTLGDAYLEPLRKRRPTSQLRLKLMNRSRPYLQWVQNELTPFVETRIKHRPYNNQYELLTEPSEKIGEYRKLFYPDGVKIIPSNIEEILTEPISIAMWYQEDGTLDFRPKIHYSMSLSTNNFSYNENVLLQKALKNNFDLDLTVRERRGRGKTYFNLYVPSKTMLGFSELIEPYIQEVFAYKSYLQKLNKYGRLRETKSWRREEH